MPKNIGHKKNKNLSAEDKFAQFVKKEERSRKSNKKG